MELFKLTNVQTDFEPYDLNATWKTPSPYYNSQVMKTYEEKLLELIKPLFDDFGYDIKGASDEQLLKFEEIAIRNHLPENAIIELKRFYKVTNGIPCLEVDIFEPDNPLLYELWDLQKQLWIGQKDMDIISWKEGRFHIGGAGNLNYGKEYIFENLLDLLIKGFKDWHLKK